MVVNKRKFTVIFILLLSVCGFSDTQSETIKYFKSKNLLCGISECIQNPVPEIFSFNVEFPSTYIIKKGILCKRNITIYPTELEFGIIRDFSEDIINYDSEYLLQFFKEQELVFEINVCLGNDLSSWDCDFTRFQIPKELCGDKLLCTVKTIRNNLPKEFASIYFYISTYTTE